MTIKESVRYNFGKFLSKGFFKAISRDIYFSIAQIYLSKLQHLKIYESWIRRSVTTLDFSPLWSDIDITIIVDDENLLPIELSRNILIKDIQFIPNRFLACWLVAGGFRNRQYKSWKSLGQSKNQLYIGFSSDRSTLAFEIVHEFYLLYSQLEGMLHQSSSVWNDISIYKILAEISRVTKYWASLDESILLVPRSDILNPNDIDLPLYLKSLDLFLIELKPSLEQKFNQYTHSPLIIESLVDGNLLNLEIKGRQVFVVSSMETIPEITKKFPKYFVCSENFLDLIKSVGVQEQTILNELAKDKKSYYFKYNLQRLACDITGAFLLDQSNQSQLYYCLKNINEFNLAIAGKKAPQWDIIEENWLKYSQLPSQPFDLPVIVKAYLDVLSSLS